MASNPFERPYPGVNYFDIYTDTSAAPQDAVQTPVPPPSNLPGGGCNYVDLTPGANGAKCGCRRFWTRQNMGSPVPDQSGWCMCNHHACYHDQGLREGPPEPQPATQRIVSGQENERPRTGREPLSPMLDMPMGGPAVSPTLNGLFGSQDPLPSFVRNVAPEPSPSQGYNELVRPPPSMPDTLSWGGDPQSQYAMPPIPSQCLMPSQATSTTSTVNAKYVRPFAGKGLQTLKTLGATTHAQSPLKQQHTVSNDDTQPNRSRNEEESFVFVTPERPSSCTLRPDVEERNLVAQGALKNLSEQVSGHEQRLDRLETVSFSAPGHEDCHEKHDHMDLRVTDLEGKIEEVEKILNDNGSVVGRRGNKNDDNVSVSAVSVATSFTNQPTHSQDLYSQLQSLKARVDQLQSALPSFNHALEVEVVFLPFPLKRIWQDIHQFKNDPGADIDDWTQLPMTHSTHTLRSQSPFYGDWAVPDHDAEWLLPRAFSEKSVTDKRLRSRGLIKSVSIKGPDARSVQSAIIGAFRDVFQAMQLPAHAGSNDARVDKYLGLKSSWVPLRKVHKDSRLRFLSPEDMVTPSTWDVNFLSSVMMRSSEPRLFITHPDAYLQNYQSYEAGWTWQKIREIDRVYPDITESQEVPEADALEEYWTWNEQLDEPPMAHTSMSMRQELPRVFMSPSVRHLAPGQSWRSASPAIVRGQSPSQHGRRASRPPHIRTTSMPMSAAPLSATSSARRRVASHGQLRRASPMTTQFAVNKRRSTRSPSRARFTPRWTTSPSPMPMGASDRPRGTTPFAYATPYSNAPLQEVPHIRGSSVARTAIDGMDDIQGTDELYHVEIYESGSDGRYEDDEDESYTSGSVIQVGPQQPPTGRQLPEDEPWPGIEDEAHNNDDHMSDGENVDPHHDQGSDVSSQPSEYPSTQMPPPVPNEWHRRDQPGFQIHEDAE